MIWYSIMLSNGWQISAFSMKQLYYQTLDYMRKYVGNTDKHDYKSVFGTLKQHTWMDNVITDKDLGFVMITSCSSCITYYKSTHSVINFRGMLK